MKSKRVSESLLIILATSVFTISFSGTRPLISLYASQLGASYFEIGLLVTMFSVLPLLTSVFLGRKVDRIGQWKPLLLSVFLGFLSLLIPFLLKGILSIYISQIFGGFAQITFIVAFQSFISRYSKKKIRDYFISIFSIGMALGHFIGPLASGILADRISYASSIGVFALAILLTLVPLILMGVKGKQRKAQPSSTSEQSKLGELLKISDLRVAFLISSTILLAKDIFIAYIPLLGVEKGFSNTNIGIIISLNSAAGLLIRIILPSLLKRFKSNHITNLTIVSAGVLFIFFPLLNSFYSIALTSLLLGFSLGIGQPLSISMTVNALPAKRVGEGLGLRLSINKLTQVAGPVLLGGASGLMGISSVFYFCGVTILTGALSLLKKNK